MAVEHLVAAEVAEEAFGVSGSAGFWLRATPFRAFSGIPVRTVSGIPVRTFSTTPLRAFSVTPSGGRCRFVGRAVLHRSPPSPGASNPSTPSARYSRDSST